MKEKNIYFDQKKLIKYLEYVRDFEKQLDSLISKFIDDNSVYGLIDLHMLGILLNEIIKAFNQNTNATLKLIPSFDAMFK